MLWTYLYHPVQNELECLLLTSALTSLKETARELKFIGLTNFVTLSQRCSQNPTFFSCQSGHQSFATYIYFPRPNKKSSVSCSHWCFKEAEPELLTSSYINWRVSADLPTPPLPTIITLWRAKELWFLLLLAAIVLLATDEVSGNQSDLQTEKQSPSMTLVPSW